MSAPALRRVPSVTPISILSALNDQLLFAPLFPGESWGAWRAFLAALFGLPMCEADAALFRHHTGGRTTLPTQQFREAALVIGRRGGKSRVLGLLAVYVACFRDHSLHVVPGETPVVAIIASDRRQARILLHYVVGTLRAVAMLAGELADQMAESVTLTNGVCIEIHTGSIASPRGRTFIAVLCDEIAFWRSEDSANPNVEVVNSVRPGLATIPDSLLLLASSPYAKRGVLWNTFKRHFGKDDARVLVWRGTTLEMNPSLDPAFIEEAREEDPAAAAAEYDAEFRSDVAAFIPREVVEAAVTHGRFELPPDRSRRFVAFCDPSGGSSDSMTLAIAHRDGEKAVLDCVREARPPFSPEAVVRDFVNVLRSYNVHNVRGDRYAGEWPRERFRLYNINYITSELPKSDIYREALPLLMSGKVDLLDNARLTSQLWNLERRTARGGRDSIDHAPGAHDDLANAAAGALIEANGRHAPTRVQKLGY